MMKILTLMTSFYPVQFVTASDNLDTESFWLLSIVSVNVAESDMMDDYHHVITKDQEYIECHYFEKEDKTRRGMFIEEIGRQHLFIKNA